MRTFVVRVYGSGESTSAEDRPLTGMVEEISTGVQTMFYDGRELLAIVNRPEHETRAASSPAAGTAGALPPPRRTTTQPNKQSTK